MTSVRIRCVSPSNRGRSPTLGDMARPWAPQFVPPKPSTTGCSVGGPTSKPFAMRSSRFDLPQPFQARSKFASRRVDTFVAVATCRLDGFDAEVSPLYAPWRHASPDVFGPPNCRRPEGWISGT